MILVGVAVPVVGLRLRGDAGARHLGAIAARLQPDCPSSIETSPADPGNHWPGTDRVVDVSCGQKADLALVIVGRYPTAAAAVRGFPLLPHRLRTACQVGRLLAVPLLFPAESGDVAATDDEIDRAGRRLDRRFCRDAGGVHLRR